MATDDKEAIIRQFLALGRTENTNKARLSNLAGQLNRFLLEISLNDIVITVDSGSIMAGRVISDPYISDEPLTYSDAERGTIECSYKLKRDIVWGKRLSREDIPYELESTLRNNSAVFEIADIKKAGIVKHWLSPIHFSDDTLHISTRIENTESISNHEMTRLSSALDSLEIASKNIASLIEQRGGVGNVDLAALLSAPTGYRYALTTQQAFMSPGDHFIQLSGCVLQRAIYAILFASMFGSEVAFAEQPIELLNTQVVDEIISVGVRLQDELRLEEVKESLDLRLPDQDEDVIRSGNERADQNEDDEFPTFSYSDDTPI